MADQFDAPGSCDRFTGLAAVYAAHRPSYPDAAIGAILHGIAPPRRVADIGCGTGISTRLVARHAAHVIGVEPNPDMILQARREPSPPGAVVEYRSASAEHTGLPDSSVDVVLCAQSFHWFDSAAALREFRRILVPGGRLALMWNVRDESHPFTAAYSAIMDRAERRSRSEGKLAWTEYAGDPLIGGCFVNAAQSSYANHQQLDREGLLGRARSASYFPRQDPFRRELEQELEDAFDTHCSDGHVTLAYSTELTLAERA